jgi:peroxiredoxin
MKRSCVILFALLFSGLGLFYTGVRIRSSTAGVEYAGPVTVEGPPKHLVTRPMLAATAKMTDVTAPAFRAQATDESFYDLKDLTKDAPIVLFFIKDGCPCSQAAQPFFNLLFDAYGKHARFFGVFDGDVANAKKWANHNQVAFPILSDPDLHTVHEYKAENSAYVALIAKGGTIEMLWPGYSVDMLADAAARLARLTGVIAKPIDAREAPTAMTTGCSY